jgi:hypothetical protein
MINILTCFKEKNYILSVEEKKYQAGRHVPRSRSRVQDQEEVHSVVRVAPHSLFPRELSNRSPWLSSPSSTARTPAFLQAQNSASVDTRKQHDTVRSMYPHMAIEIRSGPVIYQCRWRHRGRHRASQTAHRTWNHRLFYGAADH